MRQKHYIYAIINIISGKTYVGQTINIKKRWKDHIKYGTYKYGKNSFAIHSAIKKYGIKNFKLKILEIVYSYASANKKEIYFIKILKSLTPNGYNLYKGGKNASPTEETRQKISNTLKITSSFIGKKGKNHYRYGTHLSQWHKDRLSETHWGEQAGAAVLTKKQVLKIYKLGLKGMSAQKIINFLKLDVGRTTISYILSRKTWKRLLINLPSIKDLKIPQKGNPSLTEKQVIQIIKFYKKNLHLPKAFTIKKYMKIYNISRNTIYRILSNKSWKNLKK